MRNNFFNKIVASLTLTGILAPFFAFAEDTKPIPIETKLSILGQTKFADLAQYLGLFYQYLTGIAGIFAIAMIMYGGIKWIFSAGDSGKISGAKETITHAVIGLVLVLGSYLLLNTINPALVNLRMPEIKTIPAIPLSVTQACLNSGDFQGKYPCGNIVNVKNDPALKKAYESVNPELKQCFGVHCAGGSGGCFYSTQVSRSDSRAPYLCVQNNKCASSCDGITESSVGSKKEAKELCDSEACTGKIGQRCWWRNEKCEPRIQNGQACDSDAHPPACPPDVSCADLNCADPKATCDSARAPDECVRNGSLLEGEDCDRDRQCASGKCIFPPGTGEKVVVSGIVLAGATAVGFVLGGTIGVVGCVAAGLGSAGIGFLACGATASGGAAIGAKLGLIAASSYYVYESVRDGDCK